MSFGGKRAGDLPDNERIRILNRLDKQVDEIAKLQERIVRVKERMGIRGRDNFFRNKERGAILSEMLVSFVPAIIEKLGSGLVIQHPEATREGWQGLCGLSWPARPLAE